MKRITVEDAARRLGKSPQYIRVGLQKGLLPFGVAIKMPHSNNWSYLIYPAKFREFVGDEVQT